MEPEQSQPAKRQKQDPEEEGDTYYDAMKADMDERARCCAALPAAMLDWAAGSCCFLVLWLMHSLQCMGNILRKAAGKAEPTRLPHDGRGCT